ncbi:MAG: DNA translocase FtsK [Cyanobacteriota bacterium]|nr:DNA translocase FtsK [Cyanobacteriota bacterium]
MRSPETSTSKTFSVTQVKVAFECPRLFYLNKHFGGKTLFVPVDKSQGIGNAFHYLANEFIAIAKKEPKFAALFQPPAKELNREAIASKMQQLFYQLKFYKYLETETKKNSERSLALSQIWQSLIALISEFSQLLIKNRHYCQPDSLIRRTLIAGETSLKHCFQLPDGSQQIVTGRLDSLVCDWQLRRLCVVDYKTYEPIDISAQIAQVALYSFIIKKKKNKRPDSAVYVVSPEWKKYYYSWEELENSFNSLIPQKLEQMQQWLTWEKSQPNPPPMTTQLHLCEICPQQEKCQSFFGNYTARVERKSKKVKSNKSSDRPPNYNADIIGKQLVETLQSFGVEVDYLSAIMGCSFIRVKLKPHPGVKVASIVKLSKDLQVQLGISSPPFIAPQAGYVSVDLPRSDRQIASFESYFSRSKSFSSASPVKIAIGVNLDGDLVEADLSDPNTCHFLIGGTTGSGKSVFLRSLLLSLIYRHSPDNLKIALVDPKRVTFPEFEGMKWLYQPIVKDSDNAINLMTSLVVEMETRYQQFEASACADIDSYNAQSVNSFARIICIFDEYADFMAEKDVRSELELSVKRLGAMARAAGIHLIVATQRPEAKVVTPIIRSNLPGRVALRAASEADSQIILGGKETAAAYLLGKGDLLYQVGSQLWRLQSLFASSVELSVINTSFI